MPKTLLYLKRNCIEDIDKISISKLKKNGVLYPYLYLESKFGVFQGFSQAFAQITVNELFNILNMFNDEVLNQFHYIVFHSCIESIVDRKIYTQILEEDQYILLSEYIDYSLFMKDFRAEFEYEKVKINNHFVFIELDKVEQE